MEYCRTGTAPALLADGGQQGKCIIFGYAVGTDQIQRVVKLQSICH